MEKHISSIGSHVLVKVSIATKQGKHAHILPLNFNIRTVSLIVLLSGLTCDENVSFALIEPALHTDETAKKMTCMIWRLGEKGKSQDS